METTVAPGQTLRCPLPGAAAVGRPMQTAADSCEYGGISGETWRHGQGQDAHVGEPVDSALPCGSAVCGLVYAVRPTREHGGVCPKGWRDGDGADRHVPKPCVEPVPSVAAVRGPVDTRTVGARENSAVGLELWGGGERPD